MQKINSLVDLSIMKYFLPIHGILLPGLEHEVRFPQWTMPFYRKLSYMTLLFVSGYGSLMLVSLLFSKDGFDTSVFYFVSASNVFCCIVRIVFVRVYSREIHTAAKQLNRNFSNPMQSAVRQRNAKESVALFNKIFYASGTLQEMTSIVSQFYHAIVNHKNCHPSILTLDASNMPIFVPYVMYNLTTAFLFITGQSAYEWLLLVLIQLTTGEMQVLRQQLNAIFSSLRYDENCEPLVRKNLCRAALNETVGTDFVESEWQAVKDDPGYYKEKIKILDEALNQFVIHHIRTIRLSRTIRKIYGVTIVITYLYTVVMSTTWLLFSSSSSEEGNTSFMSSFAIAALMTLYLASYCGEECVSAGCNIVSDVYGMDWHLYPVSMQKKLLMILMMTQRPLFMDANGIGPLCMASYGAVFQFCYTLFSFFRK